MPLAWTVHFFFFTKGWQGRDSDQKDLTNKSEIMFGSMHNVFTFALQKKTMTTILTEGMKVKSTKLNCYHIIKTVTEKKVAYTPEIPNEGIVSNVNRIRIYTTSVRIANEMIADGTWIIE